MKKQKFWNKTTIMTFAIVFLMVFSVFGFILGYSTSPSQEKFKYNEFTFRVTNEGFVTEINNQQVAFSSAPEQAELVAVASDVVGKLVSKGMVYFTYDPDDPLKEAIALAQFSMASPLNDVLNIYAVPGFTEENEFGQPVITCQNATAFVPVILFEQSNSTGITSAGNCIMVRASYAEEMLLMKDGLLYRLVGIVQ